MERDTLIVLLFFLLLSIIVSWNALTTGGHFIYRDEWTILNEDAFKEYHFHVLNRNGSPDYDSLKRIVETWIHFFINYETFDRIKFTLLAFSTLLSSFYVFSRILENEKIERRKRTLISALGAFTYLINPLNTQLFLSYYPTLNYVLFPLFFYFLYKGLVGYSLRHMFASALIGSFMFLMVVHSALYITVSFFVVGALLITKPLKPAPLLRNILIFMLVCISSTAFALLPYIHAAFFSGPVEGIHSLNLEMLYVFSDASPLPRAMLMDFHIFWWPYVDYNYPLGDLFFPISAVFCGILLIYGVFDRSEWSMMALIALVLLFFFSKGNSSPFHYIYELLNFRLPAVGWLLRVPMKFAHIIPFFFSLLLLRLSLFTMAKKNPLFYAVPAAFLLFFCIFSWPFFTGDMAGYLKKDDYSPLMDDFKEINSIIYAGNPTVIPHEIAQPRFTDMDADFIASTFLVRELRDYDRFDDWSGLSISSRLGARYLLTSNENYEEVSPHYEQLFEGSYNSVFLISKKADAFSAPSEVHLSYGNRDTVRSLLRDPPPTGPVEAIESPYQFFNFPEEHINAADYLILTSAHPPFASVDSENKFSYFDMTIGSKPVREWARMEITSSFVMDEEYRLEPFYDFDAGYAVTWAPPDVTKEEYSEIILSSDDLEFMTVDNITEKKDNLSFIVHSHPASANTLVLAELDLETGKDYDMSISVSAISLEGFSLTLMFQDPHGSLLYKLPVLEANGTFTEEENFSFSIPPNTQRVMLAFSAIAPAEDSSMYMIDSFELNEVDYEKHGQKITSSFSIGEEGEYDIYLRLFKSNLGGKLAVYFDDAPASEVGTIGNVNHFSWEKIYHGRLSEGEHNVTVEQLGGFNTLNIGYAVKTDHEEPDMSDKSIIYRLTARTDFYGKDFGFLPATSASTFYCTYTDEAVFSDIEVLVEDYYNLSYAIAGSADILIDGEEAAERVYLEKGPHTIEVRASNSTICIDHVTLIRKIPSKAYEAEILNYTRIDASTYSVTVDSSTPFFLSLSRRYNPLWTASVNGNSYYPVSSYETVNLFYINETGLNEITIEYAPQKTFYMGAIIGIIGLSLASAYVWRSKP